VVVGAPRWGERQEEGKRENCEAKRKNGDTKHEDRDVERQNTARIAILSAPLRLRRSPSAGALIRGAAFSPEKRGMGA